MFSANRCRSLLHALRVKALVPLHPCRTIALIHQIPSSRQFECTTRLILTSLQEPPPATVEQEIQALTQDATLQYLLQLGAQAPSGSPQTLKDTLHDIFNNMPEGCDGLSLSDLWQFFCMSRLARIGR